MEHDAVVTEDRFWETLRPEGEGRRLYRWLMEEVEGAESCRPLTEELCRVADRLEEVRGKIAVQGLTVSAARGRSAKNGLLDVEIKLSGQYSKLWKTLGLADKPEVEKQPVGRPAGSDELRRLQRAQSGLLS